MIDSTSVRAHQQAATAKRGGADHCLGRSRGGLTTKIHVVVDAQGLPTRLGRTAGQTHDGQIADTLLDHLGPRTIVLADKAYDADRIRGLIEAQGATPNIPAKSDLESCLYSVRKIVVQQSRAYVAYGAGFTRPLPIGGR